MRATAAVVAVLAAGALACGGACDLCLGDEPMQRIALTGPSSGAAPACIAPPVANTMNPLTQVGCAALPALRICEVPSGATVQADGTVTLNGQVLTPSCVDPCGATQFPLRCVGGPLATDAGAAPIPSPDAALSCQIIPIPTTSSVLFHCCSCPT